MIAISGVFKHAPMEAICSLFAKRHNNSDACNSEACVSCYLRLLVF